MALVAIGARADETPAPGTTKLPPVPPTQAPKKPDGKTTPDQPPGAPLPGKIPGQIRDLQEVDEKPAPVAPTQAPKQPNNPATREQPTSESLPDQFGPPTMTDDKAIRNLLKAYEKAMGASDAEGVAKLFTLDAVMMAPDNTTIQGREMIQKAYTEVFRANKLDLTFTVDEIKPVSPRWAFARAHTKFTFKKADADMPFDSAASQDLFVLQREDDGQWRIARCSYNSTNPAVKR